MTDAALQAWFDDLFFTMVRWTDVEIVDAEDVDLDYSDSSLISVERLVSERFGVPEDVSYGEERAFLDGLVAYLGETLMRLAGGAWDWTPGDDPEGFPHGMPLVRADPALDLTPLSPVHLVQDAVRQNTGTVFAETYETWRRAVEQNKIDHPSWAPRKQPTGLDSPEPPDQLAGWIDAREATQVGWFAEYAQSGALDFSPASLPALEDLLGEVTPSTAELYSPAHRRFADGAVWYLGEVLRRGLGGRWNYQSRGDEREHGGLHLDELYLDGLAPWGSESIPAVLIEIALDEPGHLRTRYDGYTT
jgi:hypothetical protein